MSSQGYEEELLKRWFPATDQQEERAQFSETDIRGITDVLRTLEKGAWSRIPRIYIVLRLIGRLDAIDSFLQHECSDTWFPFTQRNLPEGLRGHTERSDFLEAQKLVCNTKSLNLERADARHGHFPDPSEIPLKKIGEFGKGGSGSGFVDRVISTVTHREYALKLIKRGQTFRKDKQVLRNFEKELANLKRVSREHRHIIELFGSYTDPKSVGILFPVADYDLAAFMVSPYVTEKRWSIRPYFGCLASALAFLHDNNIRHKDIKPQNILIKNEEPYFTDFGLAVDWTDFGHSTTVGPTAMTPRYGAPEVAAYEARNSSADIWSLGCVFLEMWAVLKGASIREIASLTSIDGRLLPYHSIDARLPALIDHIEKLPDPGLDSQPAHWIKNMLQRERLNRWSAHAVLEILRELGADQTTQYLYVGRCCLEDEATAESVASYVSTDQPDFRSRHIEKGRTISETRNEAPASYSPPMHKSDLRRRHNVQILDLQSRLEQLSAENRALGEAKARAEQSLYAVQRQRRTDELTKQEDDAKKPTEIDEAIVSFKVGDFDAQHGFEGRGGGHEDSVQATTSTALVSTPRRIANRTKTSIYTGAGIDSKNFRPYADHSSQASSNSYDDELGDTDDGAESLGERDTATTITDDREDTHKHGSMQAKRRYLPCSPPEGPARGIGPLSPPRRHLDIWDARTAGQDGVANTLVEGKESVQNLYAPPRPTKTPVRPSRQSLPQIPYRTDSSTDAYSSLSDALRTSIPKTTARRGPAKTKKKATEKKGFIDSMMGRLRPDQDKPKEARSSRKVARSRNTVPQSLEYVKATGERRDEPTSRRPRNGTMHMDD